MRPLTATMQALLLRLRAMPAGVELSGRDLTTARHLRARRLAVSVRRFAIRLRRRSVRREVWRLTERGRALAAAELSHARSPHTSRAPGARRSPHRDAQAGRRAC